MSTKTYKSIPTWGEVQNAIENAVGIWYIEPKTLQGVSETLYNMQADGSQRLLLVADVRVPFNEIILNFVGGSVSHDIGYACGQIVSIIGNRTDSTNQSPNYGIVSKLYFSAGDNTNWYSYNFYLMFDISLTTEDWAFIDPNITLEKIGTSAGSRTHIINDDELNKIKCSGFIKILN